MIGGPADAGGIGAAWVFTRTGSAWSQEGPKLTASDETGAGQFGATVALSADGDTALIGGSGITPGTGAAWVFTRTGSTWSQQGPKLTDHAASLFGSFGQSVALSGDGNTALISDPGVNEQTGDASVFTRTGSTWAQQGPVLTANDEAAHGDFGASVALSDDGDTALIGGPFGSAVGAAWVFTRAGSVGPSRARS